LGFGATVAEPSLIAVAKEAASVAASGGMISHTLESQLAYANGLRFTVAFAVGLGIIIGVLRIIRGWPIQYLILDGYILVVMMTMIAPSWIISIAYDSGGVTTSKITVPLVAALGLGLASTIPGRSPLIDGFGLIAFASLFPIIAVMAYAQLTQAISRQVERKILKIKRQKVNKHEFKKIEPTDSSKQNKQDR
jgi:hypothetical protein